MAAILHRHPKPHKPGAVLVQAVAENADKPSRCQTLPKTATWDCA